MSAPSAAATVTITPGETHSTGEGAVEKVDGVSALRQLSRAPGRIARAASAQPGAAMVSANNRPESGSTTIAVPAQARAQAKAPLSAPQPSVAIMIGSGAR